MTEFITREDIERTLSMGSRKAATALGVSKTSVNKYREFYGLKREDRGITEPNPKAGPKILALDLETSPNLAHVWGLWNQNVGINQLLESQEVICFGARWIGTDEVVIMSAHRDGKTNMLRKIHDMLDEADAVMGWNSKRYDMRHLNREFVENGIQPPSPTHQLDLMLEVKKTFAFPSNKLDYVARALGLKGKVKHEGHELWIKCMAGDEEAWDTMYKYQKQDVDLLIDIYDLILPWLGNHPNVGLFTGDTFACTNCGSNDLQRRGMAYSKTGKYQRYQCKSCGHWNKDYRRAGTTQMRSA